MRVLYSVENWDNDSKKFLTMNWEDARENFMKDSFDAMNIYFEDLNKKGNFNERFHIWKKIGRFGVDEGMMIHDCRHTRRKDKQICETRKDFPLSEFFIQKYMETNIGG